MVGQFETIGDSRQVRNRSTAPIFYFPCVFVGSFASLFPPLPPPGLAEGRGGGGRGKMGRWWWWHTVSTTHIPQLILVGFPLISSRRKTKRKNLFFLLCLATPRESERARISSHSLSLSPLSHILSLCLFLLLLLLCVRERECICILTIIVVVTNLLIGRIWLRSSSRNTFSSPTPQLLSPKQNKKNVFVEKWLKKISQNFIPFRSSSRNWKKFVFSPQKSFQNFEESKEVSPRCKSEL